MSDLKPCPFCGITCLSFEDGSSHRWGVASCDGCGATTGEVRRNYPDDGEWHAEAIKAWNRRAQPAQAVPLLTDEEQTQIVQQVASTSDRPIGVVAYGKLVATAIESLVRSRLGAGVGWQLVGYYHKAPSGDPDEDDMFFADAINGDCPNCHPLYMDASVKVTAKAERVPMTVEQQTEAAKAMSIKARHDPHIISFMLGIEAAERHHGIVGKEGGNV